MFVWDVASKKVLYRLQEHDHGIAAVRFSKDERLLATCGDKVDRRLIIWDMMSGYIIQRAPLEPNPVNVCTLVVRYSWQCIAWADKEIDVKNKPTDIYLLACAGGKDVRENDGGGGVSCRSSSI